MQSIILKCIFTSIIIFISTCVKAQEIVLLRKNLLCQKLIETKKVNFVSSKGLNYFYVKPDTLPQYIGFMGKKIYPYLQSNNEAKKYFKKYKNDKILAIVSKITALGLYTTSIVTLTNKSGNNSMFLYYLSSGVLISSIGISYKYLSSKNLIKSVEFKNNLEKK
jgi:hypothetical protein